MPLSLPTAVGALAETAGVHTSQDRIARRIEDLQDLLSDDLESVEHAVAAVSDDGVEPATDAARHLIVRGGKRVRPLALLLSAACFGSVPAVARELAVVAELVHSATLLHDDVIDEGQERRGAKTARRVWGNAISVLAGDLVLVHALQKTMDAAPETLPDLLVTLRSLVDGEVVQLRGRSQLDVSEATYERVLRDKTASLFRWATRTGARVAGATHEQQNQLANFGERLGIAFQLVDDVLDYAGDRTGKSLLVDLTEGKMTLPLVLAVRRRPELEEQVRRIHAGDAGPVAAVSRSVVESGACDEVRRRARRFTERAVSALTDVAPGPARSLLEEVAFQLSERAA
jgi:octaprenyl-diphosphate synthase